MARAIGLVGGLGAVLLGGGLSGCLSPNGGGDASAGVVGTSGGGGPIGLVARSELPAAMTVGVLVLAVGGLAWSLIPRIAVLRFIATCDGLTVVGDGVPVHLGQRFVADEVEGVFVRALARAERPEDRRLELVLLDRHGGRQTLLRGLDDPAALSWVAVHIERALGF